MRRVGQGLVGAAVLIAVVTVVARVVGFVRVVVLARTVGTTCLGDVYATANAVPNIVYEVVVGGALAAAVVPLVAASVAGHEPVRARQTVAALHGWALLLLVPVTALTYLVSGPLVVALLGSSNECADALMHQTAQEMLWVFLLQIPVYGVTVVAQGALQAHRSFLAPALAPLLSSLFVIGTYLAYAELAGAGRGSLVSLTTSGFLVLTVGTTLGVVVLLLVQVPALHRRGLLVRPALTFPEGLAPKARLLAVSGIVTVAAQWLAYAVAIRLANVHGPEGAVILLTLAWTVFMLPWAVMVFPIATSVFPRLSTQYDQGDVTGFEQTAASSTRVVLVSATLGAAGLAAAAGPLASLMVSGAPGPSSVTALASALAAFAPGVIGYGVHGHLTRVLAARHASQVTAVVSVGGWGIAALAATLLAVEADDSGDPAGVMAGITAGLSVGLVSLGALMLVAVLRVVGVGALSGVGRSLAAAALAGAAATVLGRAVSDGLAGPEDGAAASLLQVGVVGLVVLVVFVLVAGAVDRETTRAALRRVRQGRAGRR